MLLQVASDLTMQGNVTYWIWGTGCHFKTAIFNLVLLIGVFTSSNDNPLRWMPRDLTDDKSTLVQVMAWCRQAKGHYLSQCWPSSMSPYGITRPQWVLWMYYHMNWLIMIHYKTKFGKQISESDDLKPCIIEHLCMLFWAMCIAMP